MTMGLEDDGDPTTGMKDPAEHSAEVSMDLEETSATVVEQLAIFPARTSLQTESAKTAGKTPNGMQKIDEVYEEEEEILGTKTRNWKKISLAFMVPLDGAGADILDPETQNSDKPMEGSNKPMKHHPIMTPIAKFINSIEKKCKHVKVMSSKNKMVLDPKVCIDSWSINKFKDSFAYAVSKRQRNVQVTLYIDYDKTYTLRNFKQIMMEELKDQKLWIVNHNGPIELVATTQIGFFAKIHPELYRIGFQDDINKRISDLYTKTSSDLIIKAHEYPGTKDFVGPNLPEVQIIPLNIPGSTSNGRSPRVQAVGVSVPSKFKALFQYILSKISNEMGIDYVDFAMKYDQQRKELFNKLIRTHQEFMHNHRTIHIHCMERQEMEECVHELKSLRTVVAVDETVITERNGTWVLIMKQPLDRTDLDKIDRIIDNNPVKKDRTLGHAPFRKRDRIEVLDYDALSAQENKYKNFRATPFSKNDSWSTRLFPPTNITTKRGGRSTKTSLSINDEDTVATLTDTVFNLQRSVERLQTELTQSTRTLNTIDTRLTTEEARGEQQGHLIGFLEESQTILAQTMSGQMELLGESADRTTASATEESAKVLKAIADAKTESDKAIAAAKAESNQLKIMLQQLLQNNINNNVTPSTGQTNITNNNTAQQQQIYGSGAVSQVTIKNNTGQTKRKSDTTTNPNNQTDPTSPERQKQRQDDSTGTVPIEIDFSQFTEDTDVPMDVQNHPGNNEDHQQNEMQGMDDIIMDNQYETNNASQGIGYIRSANSFGTRDTNSEGTSTVIEEEMSITDHNFNNVINETDYTTTAEPITPNAWSKEGFTNVQNGASPTRCESRVGQQERFSNPYSALQSPVNDRATTKKTKKKTSQESAKTDDESKDE
jgi:chorismate mutase